MVLNAKTSRKKDCTVRLSRCMPVKESFVPQIFRLAQAAAIALLAMTGFAQAEGIEASPSGFFLVAVDDCGNWAREPHLVEGLNGEVAATSAPEANLEERTFSE